MIYYLQAKTHCNRRGAPEKVPSLAGKVVRDSHGMCNVAADFYETFFRKSPFIRLHPYTDSPPIDFDNKDEVIPAATINELLNVVQSIKKRNRVMHMEFLVLCLNFLILITGLFSYLYLIVLSKLRFFLQIRRTLE